MTTEHTMTVEGAVGDERKSLRIRRGVSAATVALLLAFGAGCSGANEQPINTPVPGPQGMPMPGPMPGGQGGNGAGANAQFGVPDAIPGAGKKMNAAAFAAYQQGLAAFAQGELVQAQGHFKKATEEDDKAFQAFYSLGSVQQRLGKSSAMSSYRKAFTILPEYDRAIVAYGMLVAKTGSLAEADKFLSEKRGRLPKSASIAAALAEVKSLQKDTAGAQQLAQEALKLNPSHPGAMMTIARDHYRNRRLDLSLYALKAILDGFGEDNPPRDKNNAEARLLRAFIFREQNNRVGALTEFRRAMELRPDLVVARIHLATYLLESGDAEEALPILQHALRFDKENLAVHLSLGDAQRLLTNYAEAKKEFEWVRSREPNLAAVHYNFGLLYLFAAKMPGMTPRQKVEAAIKSFEKFKELSNKSNEGDVDELLNRAKLQKAEMDALDAANKPKPAPAPAPAPKKDS